MLFSTSNNKAINTTTYKVVLPFYAYASIAFFIATLLLFFSTASIGDHYFQPRSLAIIHIMALGWGTMMILGASHQLVPVLIEGRLFSNLLAYLSFILAAIGIPLLVYGFYIFDMGLLSQCGAILICLAIVAYLVNLAMSMIKSTHENVHAFAVFTAAIWLLTTAIVGLLLVYNFNYHVFSQSSLAYLPLHAHIGIVGWFLLLITGVGSRLIPMFLISKYNNPTKLWWIYFLINVGLLIFIFNFLFFQYKFVQIFSILIVAAAIVLFGEYCFHAYLQRIRKKVDEQVGISIVSVLMMLLPLIFLVAISAMFMLLGKENIRLVITYGFVNFFGWITAIILGMTFKTLPFIVWNKEYHLLAGKGKTPNPKDLFSSIIFKYMLLAYIVGFVLFVAGLMAENQLILRIATAALLITALFFNLNVFKLLFHKSTSA